jgi:hypothetical protein
MAPARVSPARSHPWNPLPPLLLGLSFGLAFAITYRLLDGRFASLVRLGERFEVKTTPGVGLESLRMRYGLQRVDLNAPPPEAVAPAPAPAPEVEPAAPAGPTLPPPPAEPPLSDPLRHSFAPPAEDDGRGAVVPGPVPTFTGGPALPEAPPLPAGSATVMPPPANRR